MLRPAVTVLTAAVLALALAACSADEQAAPRPAPTTTFTAGDVPVLVPGAPGESPEVVAPGESGTVENADYYGDEDVAFVSDMLVHHAQALRMAELAPTRAGNEHVRRLAERIAAAQGPEMQVMRAWLEARDLPVPDLDAQHGGHDGMPGMATPEELTRLAAAEGTAFDRLFLELMTRHHEGALAMAEQPGGAAQHPLVVDMVADVAITQTVEIARMQELLADL